MSWPALAHVSISVSVVISATDANAHKAADRPPERQKAYTGCGNASRASAKARTSFSSGLRPSTGMCA